MKNEATARSKANATGMALSLVVGALAVPTAVLASTTITIDSVTQRYPWNNKVDITYTVTGGQDLTSSNFCKVVFTTLINGATYTIDGVKDVGASMNAGTHTVTWDAPSGVQSANCTMSAAVYAADAPSGDDYMIIDLTKTSDNIVWEGRLATQEASNARYNTNEYKKDKLVLRKIPAGTYSTGYAGTPNNSPKTYTTDRDYYIGVFEITHYQYVKIGSDATYNPGYGNSTTRPIFPAHNVSWDDLRLSTTASTSAIPAVATAASTLTLVPPSGTTSVRHLQGTGVESIRLREPGVWQLALAFSGTTLASKISVVDNGFVLQCH